MAELFYDRQGNPIDVNKWNEYFGNLDYKIVARDVLDDGKVVSTVWLGTNHNYGDGPPAIFETMIFESEDNFSDLYMDRYSTEAEALEGHKKALEIAPTLEQVEWH